MGLIDIRSGEMFEGNLPRRALRLIQDWMEAHTEELAASINQYTIVSNVDQLAKIARLGLLISTVYNRGCAENYGLRWNVR